ncbi:MAG: alpha/beta fold hydrolase [Pseudomonadota bacterium]
MYSNIEFQSEGATLRGRLYLPVENDSLKRDGRYPVVVMAHGFSATLTMASDKYAEAIRDSGLAVLLYDHRNLGISDGEPRGEINPWVQARGYRDAIDFASTQSALDSDRIAIWGDSLSGGQVLVVAACDERVKAVVSQVGGCGPKMPPNDPDQELFEIVKQTLLHGDVSVPDVMIGPMPVISADQNSLPSILKPLSAFRWFLEYGGRHGSGWVNWGTRFLPKTPAPYHPGLCAPKIRVPVLAFISLTDEMENANPEVMRSAIESIPGDKEIVEIDGGHFELLFYPSETFQLVANKQCGFLRSVLA